MNKPLSACLMLCLLVALPGCHASRVSRPKGPTLVITDLTVGTGAVAQRGDMVTVVYDGWLSDGTKVDSSRRRPFWFLLGNGQVIAGWDLGVPGMRVGGTRRLVIPPSMAYGEAGAGGVIPPNATLIYEIELVDVQPPQ
jgi:FKBP-type peptidyl-prolyl cis-trans isomerase FkpA